MSYPMYPLLTLSIILLALSSPGYHLSFFAWFSLIPLFFACQQSTKKKAFYAGLTGGTVYYCFLIYWVVISMETYGGLPKIGALGCLLLLAFYMAIYFAIFCTIISTNKTPNSLIWQAPVIWVSLDYIRSFLFTGFPWMDLGYSQFNTPFIIQISDIFGHGAVTFLIVLTNSLCFALLNSRTKQEKPSSHAIWAIIILAISLAYSGYKLAKTNKQITLAPIIKTTVVQANINQAVKWDKKLRQNSIDRHIELSNGPIAQQSQLVIWPETALAFFPTNYKLLRQVYNRTVKEYPYDLLSGIPYYERKNNEPTLYNSAMLLTEDELPTYYFKQHLVPFGEYVPLKSILPIPKPIVEAISNFSAAQTGTLLTTKNNIAVATIICFEAIYPAIARKMTLTGGQIIANITNDAWFGHSKASIQHLAMTTFRAVENRRSLARAANTGISAFVLPSGEIKQATTIYTATSRTTDLPIFNNITFFCRYGHFFPLICCLISVILLISNRVKH